MEAKVIETNKKFFDKVADFYDSGILHSWLHKILKKSLKNIVINNNSIVLDAGCGTGNLLFLLEQENKNLSLYGIDISPEMLKIAKRKLGKKAKLKLMQVESLNYKEKFGYIFSSEAFHHYSNQEKAMNNFHNSLKKNGKLIVVDLNFGKVLNWIFHKIEPGNSRMNSAEDFRRLFKDSKFKDINQKKIGLFVIMTTGEK